MVFEALFQELETKIKCFFFNFYFYFILLYNTVLVLPHIDMKIILQHDT